MYGLFRRQCFCDCHFKHFDLINNSKYHSLWSWNCKFSIHYIKKRNSFFLQNWYCFCVNELLKIFSKIEKPDKISFTYTNCQNFVNNIIILISKMYTGQWSVNMVNTLSSLGYQMQTYTEGHCLCGTILHILKN